MKDNFKPLVSIIIPVYNGSNYMQEAIDSALNQTYQNIEILVINDGSNDKGKTKDIAESYGQKIRYFEKENGGVTTALNLGIEEMEGDYFSWLSHDDVYYPFKLEKQVNILANLTDRNLMLYSSYDWIDKDSSFIKSSNFHNLALESNLNLSLYPVFFGMIHGCSLLIPKQYFEDFGIFDEKLKTTQDYDLWYRMLKKGKIHFIEEALIMSRVHDEQGSRIIPNHSSELNDLWINMIKNVSSEEILSFQDSEIKFYSDVKKILNNDSLKKACDFADLKLNEKIKEKKIEDIKVSIIIPANKDKSQLERALTSITEQTHKNCELILLYDHPDILEISKKYKNTIHNIVELDIHNAEINHALNLGLKTAAGDYITFLEPNDSYKNEKIEYQLSHMHENGYLFSYTDYIQEEDNLHKEIEMIKGPGIPGLLEFNQIEFSTVMISKRLVHKNYCFFENTIESSADCLWISIAKRFNIIGIDKQLSVIEREKEYNIRRISNILNYVTKDTELLKYNEQISELYFKLSELYKNKENKKYIIPNPGDISKSKLESIKLNEYCELIKKISRVRMIKIIILHISYPLLNKTYSFLKRIKKNVK